MGYNGPNETMGYNGPKEFAHLHSHSIYSALDGVATIPEYANRCYENNWPGMAITEHGHMGSVPDFYLTFKEYGLKPIFGCELYYNDYERERQKLEAKGIKVRSMEWRKENPEFASRIARNRHLTVLCKNEIGYHNLIKLTTQAYKEGLFGMGRTQYNRVWFDKLCEYKEGLIVLSGCLNGPVSHELRYRTLLDKEGNVVYERSAEEARRDAVNYVEKFKKEFGDDYYIELQMPGIPGNEYQPSDEEVFRGLLEIADEFGIKTVLANDSHYLNRKDYELQKLMMAIAQDTTMDSPDLFHVNSDEQFMKSREQLWDTFKSKEYCKGVDDRAFEEMCNNTLEIVDKCEMPDIDVSPKIPTMENADNKLKRIVYNELIRRGLDKDKNKYVIDGKEVTYAQQAKLESDRFVDKGFSSYFLITRDLVQYGRRQEWPFSPRGSAAGSLVCFLLGITCIDPIRWGLSFDRFLSPSRGGYMLNVKMGDPVN